jgi:putative hemolysin
MIWVLLAFLLICSGTVSACETALFGLSRRTLHDFRTSDRAAERRVGELMRDPRRTLLTILITNTGVNVAFFAVSFMALGTLRDKNAALGVAASLGTLLLVIVFGEILPKAIALTRAVSIAPLAADIVSILQAFLGPLRWVLAVLLVNPLTRLFEPAPAHPAEIGMDELQTLVEQSAREGVINSHENQMLQAVVAMSSASIREVMTPRVDMVSVSENATGPETAKAFEVAAVSLLPVHRRDVDDVVGVVQLRDVRLNPKKPVNTLLQDAYFVPEQATLLQVFRQFRENRAEAAVVVDEFGGTSGFVTVDDIAHRALGSARGDSEASRCPTTERVDRNTYRLSGDLSVREWASRFGVVEFDRRIDTVAGLILAKLGRLPHRGDRVEVGNLSLAVEEMKDRRIERVLLHRMGTQPTDAAIHSEDQVQRGTTSSHRGSRGES